MKVIPINKTCSRKQLEDNGYQFTDNPTKVCIQLNNIEIEAYKHEIVTDADYNEFITITIYTNKDLTFIFAVDELIRSEDGGEIELIIDTPFYQELMAAIELCKIYKYKGYLVSEKRCNDHLTDFDIYTDNYLVSRFALLDKYLMYKEKIFDEQIESFETCVKKGILRP